jgi:hypothetical protein
MPSKSQKKTISVIIDQDTYEGLKELADSKLWSVSQTGAVLIKEGLNRAKAEQAKTSQS